MMKTTNCFEISQKDIVLQFIVAHGGPGGPQLVTIPFGNRGHHVFCQIQSSCPIGHRFDW